MVCIFPHKILFEVLIFRTLSNSTLDEGERLFRKFCKRAEKYVKKMKLLNLANENLKKLKPKNISFKLS
jgi:hypothetical protein